MITFSLKSKNVSDASRYLKVAFQYKIFSSPTDIEGIITAYIKYGYAAEGMALLEENSAWKLTLENLEHFQSGVIIVSILEALIKANQPKLATTFLGNYSIYDSLKSRKLEIRFPRGSTQHLDKDYQELERLFSSLSLAPKPIPLSTSTIMSLQQPLLHTGFRFDETYSSVSVPEKILNEILKIAIESKEKEGKQKL
jgi:hypothetical protein